MATSVVSICNLALQKLGAQRITALDEDSNNARDCNACYEQKRDQELRANKWKFSICRATLAPSATEPDFDFAYAFPVPTDFLRLLPPNRNALDWTMESHTGTQHILTNDGDTLEIRYIKRITDPEQFDPLFVEMLACSLALQLSEKITQSNTKKDSIKEDYKRARAEARLINAFEQPTEDDPEDPWLAARR
jgi:hypothetical protein